MDSYARRTAGAEAAFFMWPPPPPQAHGESAGTAAQGEAAAALLEHMAPTITSSGWATVGRIRQPAEACRLWGADPDASDAVTWCEAAGRA